MCYLLSADAGTKEKAGRQGEALGGEERAEMGEGGVRGNYQRLRIKQKISGLPCSASRPSAVKGNRVAEVFFACTLWESWVAGRQTLMIFARRRRRLKYLRRVRKPLGQHRLCQVRYSTCANREERAIIGYTFL